MRHKGNFIMAHSVYHVATSKDTNKRLDVLLAELSLYASRSAAVHAIEDGRVLVNGDCVPKKHIVEEGEAIVCELDDDDEDLPVVAQPIDLDIRYEDDDIIVLSKQAGLLCHPSIDHPDSTLVNALLYHCGKEHLCNVQGENDRLGIVHRLDGDTSGLMLAAKNNTAGRVLMEDISVRAVQRQYLALVHGIIAQDTGMIDAPIARSAHDRKRMAVRDCSSSREAITTFRVLERFSNEQYDDGYTLIECKLFTGRTHQIRVHMQYIHHPVVGDPMYCAGAPRDDTAQLGLTRQFLHSYMISFTHPINGENLSFCDNLPKELRKVLLTLQSRSCGKTEAGVEVYSTLDSAPSPSIESGLVCL